MSATSPFRPSAAGTLRDADQPSVSGLPANVALQILATEHWSLLSTRSLTWNESFSRTTMFLSTLSGSIVAMAVVAQASSFGRESLWFVLALLAIALTLGLGTFARLLDVNREDVLWVRGMNRLRKAYVELAPDLGQYLIASTNDDEAGVLRTLGAKANVSPLYHHVLMTTPAIVAVIDAGITAAVLACVSLLAGLPMVATSALSLGGFASMAILLLRWQLRATDFGNTRKRPIGTRGPREPIGAHAGIHAGD